MENDFILSLEKEVFIEQLKDIVDKAEDMLSEDTEGERYSDQGGSPKHNEGAGTPGTEVRKEPLTVIICNVNHCYIVLTTLCVQQQDMLEIRSCLCDIFCWFCSLVKRVQCEIYKPHTNLAFSLGVEGVDTKHTTDGVPTKR